MREYTEEKYEKEVRINVVWFGYCVERKVWSNVKKSRWNWFNNVMLGIHFQSN
jgi:hypothetical protein